MLSVQLQSLSFAGMAPAVVQRASATAMMAKSASLPFLEAPSKLDGTMAGDKVRQAALRCPRPKRSCQSMLLADHARCRRRCAE